MAPKSATHPTYFEMITDAVTALKDRTGSSQQAITKFLEEKHKDLPATFRKLLSNSLKKAVNDGKLVMVKASYKLAPKAAPTAAKPATKKAAPVKKTAAATTKAGKPGIYLPKPKVAARKAPMARKAPVKAKAVSGVKRKAAAAVVEKKKPVAKKAKTVVKKTPTKKAAPVKKAAVKVTPKKVVAKKGGKSPATRVSARKGKGKK